jgi:hypothetical protein
MRTAATGRLVGIIDAEGMVEWEAWTISTCVPPDGKYIVGGHDNGTVKLWQTRAQSKALYTGETRGETKKRASQRRQWEGLWHRGSAIQLVA